MKWDDLTDKDKVKLILQHVIPHEIADDIVFEQGHVEVKRRWTKDNPCKPIEWPVAAWDSLTAGEEDGCWMTRDIWSNWDTAFDPLHDMNDAWQIVECVKFAGVLVERLYKTSDERKYVCKITSRADDQSASIPMRRQASSFGKTAQDAVCKAALKVMGVEIE